jgi:SAM-dependent methyltransferase
MTLRLMEDLYAPERLEARLRALTSARHGMLRTWLHRRLRLFFSDFDVNAWLGMYPMTYLTTEEWARLLPPTRGRLLDVGAGSGDLTRALGPLWDEVICTETSNGMARRLERQGFETHLVDLARDPPPAIGEVDAVALLHVLDRCDAPVALFDRALSLVRPGGLVLVAIPLPYAPLVYRGARSDAPGVPLLPEGLDEDEARTTLEDRLFASRGLELLVVARVPYLCPGDLETPYYALDSTLFVARRG